MDAVRLDQVSVRRAGTEIVQDVSWQVARGEHWALIGPNGAGKTTVMNLVAATSFPTKGTVEVLGNRLGRVDVRELRRSIGHVSPRHPLGSNLTALEVVLTGETATVELVVRHAFTDEVRARGAALCKEVGLDAPEHLHWNTMSQGERGKVLIARALMTDPPLLLLDEPSTGLDLAAREQMIATVADLQANRPGLTSVTVTHHFEELPPTTSHAALLRAGRLVASGPVEEVLTSDLVSRTFAHPVTVERRNGRWAAWSA